MSVESISDKGHYGKVVERVASVNKSLWIGTSDIKDLHVKSGNGTKPFLGVLADLLRRGVEQLDSVLVGVQSPYCGRPQGLYKRLLFTIGGTISTSSRKTVTALTVNAVRAS